ncbi:protocatechuate 3,4-dioxygenase subunit alpha [Georgenia alba]|uniref:Protocatechuate 3,4-dioxygenase subunit alpha n=1 Tax=Georgenia alba TaxID=2233858 RepID=A0ABW2QCP1_9MICO
MSEQLAANGRLGLTPSQTVGPFLAIGLEWGDSGRLAVPEGTPGAFWIRGQVLDGEGEPLPDALVEIWQADPEGRFDHPDDPRGARPAAVPGFTGFARSSTWNDTSTWSVHTLRPGPLPARDVEDPDGPLEAPHIDVSVLARGMLDRVVTRIYFPDEPLNDTDPVLSSVPEERRHTLLAQKDAAGGSEAWRFDITLQGAGETVFFEV